MENSHISRLRKASIANNMWDTFISTNDGDPFVVFGASLSAAAELADAVRDAIKSGMTPDQVAHEACLPYVSVLVMSGYPAKNKEEQS